MASLTKHPKSQYWTACFTGRDGRQMKRSTKTTDRNQAYEVAIELERIERQAKQGVLTTTQLRKVLNDVSVKVTGDSLAVPTTEKYLNEWLEGVGARNTPATRERYGNTVKIFLACLKDKGQTPVSSVMPIALELQKQHVVGDLAFIPLRADGQQGELKDAEGQEIVFYGAIELPIFEAIARNDDKAVVLVARSTDVQNKVPVIYASIGGASLAGAKGCCYVSHLVTDERTARGVLSLIEPK